MNDRKITVGDTILMKSDGLCVTLWIKIDGFTIGAGTEAPINEGDKQFWESHKGDSFTLHIDPEDDCWTHITHILRNISKQKLKTMLYANSEEKVEFS